ncbi:hypothetical protein EYZ11_006697 [Aspergillus tanneri]|uniref:Protein kinase domain-containing protein n=1 Tax=Aspergillus tanneri TaxID=1220188 RepID=A0A4S3JFD8_9EURO|nr:hypothetical protein EYZ11_006697 [Aspergillus tanneri]
MTDFLYELLDANHKRSLHQAHEQTMMQVLYLNTKVAHLLQIVQASGIPTSLYAILSRGSRCFPSASQTSSHTPQGRDPQHMMAILARFKTLRMSIISDQYNTETLSILLPETRSQNYFNDHDRDKRENRFESTSLFAILLECDKSSLSSRVCLVLALANAILHLHSISWVHKVIRSHTVIFFRKPGNAELSDTYLWGFGLSRPAQQTEMTERPDSNPLYNLYRHPLAHGDAATATIGGFKKGFTSTALGSFLWTWRCGSLFTIC